LRDYIFLIFQAKFLACCNSWKLKSLLHWFIIFQFKIWSGTKTIFSSLQPENESVVASDVVRCVTFDGATSLWCISFKVTTRYAFFLLFYSLENVLRRWSIQWYIILVWCWVAAVSEREKGRAHLIQSFSPIKSPICIANVEEQGMTEKDEDDKGVISFATLESRFENRETVRNWLAIKLLCLQNHKMAKAPFALANPDLTTSIAVVPRSHRHTTDIRLQSKAYSNCLRQCFSCLLRGENRCNVRMQILQIFQINVTSLKISTGGRQISSVTEYLNSGIPRNKSC